jgi:uncharacterized protein YcnI
LNVRRSVVLAGIFAMVLLPATAASAHVTIEPPSAPKGTDGVISFVVPNEMDNANTTELQVTFPTDHLIPDVNTAAVPGWTAKVTMAHSAQPLQTDTGTTNDYVQSITWSGGSIPPGQFAEFPVALGLPDDASSLTFKALQTYSNGQIVRWIELSEQGQPEPDHPAPVLTLTSGSGDSAAATTATTVAGTSSTSNNDASTAKTLAILAICISVATLLAAILFAMRARMRPKRAA